MTPEQQASEIFSKFYDISPLQPSLLDTVEEANNKILKDITLCRRYAIVSVDFIIKSSNINTEYWYQVRNELQTINPR